MWWLEFNSELSHILNSKFSSPCNCYEVGSSTVRMNEVFFVFNLC